jgi:hypothetical protein
MSGRFLFLALFMLIRLDIAEFFLMFESLHQAMDY